MKPGRPLHRTTPLIATTGLERRTGLSTSTELQRRTELARGHGPTSRGPAPAQRESWEQWAEVKARAWKLWGHRCVVHGHLLAWPDLHGHHRQLRSAGGPDTLPNCLPLCHTGHSEVHRGGNSSYDAGWLVRSWGLPTAWPVTAWDGTTWFITDDGERWPV